MKHLGEMDEENSPSTDVLLSPNDSFPFQEFTSLWKVDKVIYSGTFHYELFITANILPNINVQNRGIVE